MQTYEDKLEWYDLHNLYVWGSEAKGTWVTRPITNKVKVSSLQRMHMRSKRHLAAVKKPAPSLSTDHSGNVVQQILPASEDQEDHLFSLCFSQASHFPQWRPITLQIENDDIRLKALWENCPPDSFTTTLTQYSLCTLSVSIEWCRWVKTHIGSSAYNTEGFHIILHRKLRN